MNSRNASNPDKILSANDLYNINEEVTGMTPFVRDKQLLYSAVRRPYLILFGVEQFPTLLDKAAATMHSLAAHHLFQDGNKRTALRATQLFLEANGISPIWTDKAAKQFVLEIARGIVEIEVITAWLIEHTQSPD